MPYRKSLVCDLHPAIAAFSGAAGFVQRDLMATAETRPKVDASRKFANVMSAIQCELERTYALVRLQDSPRADWVRRSREALLAAGYEERGRSHEDDDEVALERSLLSSRELRTEIRVLALIGRLGLKDGLPLREPRPQGPRSRSRTSREWLAALAALEAAKLEWSSCVASYERRGQLGDCASVEFDVRLCAIADATQPLSVVLLVGILEPTAARPVATRAIASLAAAGYETSGRGPRYNCVKTFSDAVEAAHEGGRVFAELARA